MREPATVWEREGNVCCRFVPIPSGFLGRWGVLRQAAESDVVILQKKTSLHRWDLAQLSRANSNIVFDFDDAVMFHEVEHGQVLTGKNFRKFLRTVRNAKSVVAGNGFLARFARDAGCDVTVLPTPVDPDRYRTGSPPEAGAEPPVVGWLGVSQNLKYLEPLKPVFRDLEGRFPELTVKVVSDRFPVDLGVRTDRKAWALSEEPRDIASFSVGIMPLPDTLWGWGKCGYKLLQYLASGVPVVASPIGLNLDIVQEGRNGYFARTPGEWVEKLAFLLSRPALAAEMGKRGQQDVERRYSLGAYAAAYLELLTGTRTPRDGSGRGRRGP